MRKSSSPNSKYLEYGDDALGQLVSASDHAAGLEYTYSFVTAANTIVWNIAMLLKSIGLYEDVNNYIIEAHN